MKHAIANSRWSFGIVIWWFTIPGIANASQHVQFDVEPIVECQRATPLDSGSVSGDQDWLRARLSTSSLMLPNAEAGPIQYLFRLENPERTLTIVDYEPKSSVRSPVVGDIQVHRSRQRASTAGVSASGHLKGLATLEGSLGHNHQDSSELKYAVQPAAQQIASSGTLRRGRGVYFKFQPAPQQAREGARQLEILFRVPRDWRADYVRVLCEARDGDDPERLLGTAHFIVALYREDDPTARLAAERLLESEQALTDLAWSYRDEIERQRYSSLAHEWAANLDLSQPKIPQRWLYFVLHRLTAQEPFSFESRLPVEVKEAAAKYAKAKLAIHQLAQGNPTDSAPAGVTRRMTAKPIGPVTKRMQWTARQPKNTAVD